MSNLDQPEPAERSLWIVVPLLALAICLAVVSLSGMGLALMRAFQIQGDGCASPVCWRG